MTHARLSLAGSLASLGLATLVLLSPTDARAQSLGTCNTFYPAGYTLPQGKSNPALAPMSKPAKGSAVREPNFGTCLVRATDHAREEPSTFARNDYSRRQAFNADNSRFIVYSNDGWWHQYDANTLRHIGRLSPRAVNPSTPAEFHLAGDAEPQWHPTDPNTLYYVTTNGGTKLLKLDVRNNTHQVAADFAGKLPSWGSTARHIWTKSEGSPSADGRYWGFQVEDANFNLLGYMVWDLEQNRLAGSLRNTSRPDHSSMSAAGRWFITSSDTTGTWAWSRDFTTKKKLLHKSEHSDLALGPNGQDYYVAIDYQSGSGDVFFVDIDACPSVPASASDAPVCPRTVLFPTYMNGASAALHISGKGFGKPGWAVVSTYATRASRDGSMPWYANKIFAVELKANPRTYPIAYTRVVDGSYWAEPHASVSRDFTRVIFNSNWGTGGDDIDSYIVHLPASALPGGSVAPPPSAPTIGKGGNQPSLAVNGSGTARAPVASAMPVSPSAPTTTSTPPQPADALVSDRYVAITPPAVRMLDRSRAWAASLDTPVVRSAGQQVRRLAPLLVTPPALAWTGLATRLWPSRMSTSEED